MYGLGIYSLLEPRSCILHFERWSRHEANSEPETYTCSHNGALGSKNVEHLTIFRVILIQLLCESFRYRSNFSTNHRSESNKHGGDFPQLFHHNIHRYSSSELVSTCSQGVAAQLALVRYSLSSSTQMFHSYQLRLLSSINLFRVLTRF